MIVEMEYFLQRELWKHSTTVMIQQIVHRIPTLMTMAAIATMSLLILMMMTPMMMTVFPSQTQMTTQILMVRILMTMAPMTQILMCFLQRHIILIVAEMEYFPQSAIWENSIFRQRVLQEVVREVIHEVVQEVDRRVIQIQRNL